jgi:hypothetical protein
MKSSKILVKQEEVTRNQEEREFIVTKDMLYELVNEHVSLGKDETICSENFYVTLKK